MPDGAVHAGWLLMRGGTLRRWQNRYCALFPASATSAGPALRFKRQPGDAGWLSSLPLDMSSTGALPLGDGHPTAACFCAFTRVVTLACARHGR
jgi:hypothetical protein